MDDPRSNLGMPSDYGVRTDLLLKAQQAIMKHLIPALHNAIDDVTNFMYEPDADDQEIYEHLRETAVETVIDELVRSITRDTMPPSKRYMVNDVDGIGIDTLIACYAELQPDQLQAWFSSMMHVTPQDYQQMVAALPEHMDI